MMTFLLVLTTVVVVLLILKFFDREEKEVMYVTEDEDDVVTTTTTTVTTTTVVDTNPSYEVVGELQRRTKPDGTLYVVDPVDRDEVVVSPTDDMYEDGAGKIWSLR